jgi:hypothetical protein
MGEPSPNKKAITYLFDIKQGCRLLLPEETPLEPVEIIHLNLTRLILNYCDTSGLELKEWRELAVDRSHTNPGLKIYNLEMAVHDQPFDMMISIVPMNKDDFQLKITKTSVNQDRYYTQFLEAVSDATEKFVIIVPVAVAEKSGMLSNSGTGSNAIKAIKTIHEYARSKITRISFFSNKISDYLNQRKDDPKIIATVPLYINNSAEKTIMHFTVSIVRQANNGEVHTKVARIIVGYDTDKFVITLEPLSDDIDEFKEVCKILQNYVLPNAGQGGRRKQRKQRTQRKRSYRKIKSRRSRT